MEKLFVLGNILVVIALLFSYISPFVNPSVTWFFSFFGLGYPFIIIANVSFVLYWLVFRPKYALLSAFFLLVGIMTLQKTYALPKGKETSSIEDNFTVMSFNIGKTRIDFHKEKGREAKINRFMKFIAKESPDIVCIQERLPRHFDYYVPIFEGYNLYPNEKIGTAIYSKHRIVNSGNIPFDTKSHNATWADIEIDKKIYRIYCIHLSSNHVTNLTDNVKEIWDESKYIFSKYHHHSKIRVSQLSRVLDHAEKSPHPVLLAGDFNDVPQSYVYSLACKNYDDTFVSGGQGLGQTYNSRFIGLRIDYCFANNKLEVIDHRIIRNNISDHYPIVTTIKKR